MFEKIALKKQLITEEQLNQALSACSGAEDREAALKEYFISNNFISKRNMQQLLHTAKAVREIKKDIKFGEIALKMELIDKQTLSHAQAEQTKSALKGGPPKLIGKILVEAGKLTEQDRDSIIEMQRTSGAHSSSGKQNSVKFPENGIEKSSAGKREKEAGKADVQGKFAVNRVIDGGMKLKVDEKELAAYLTKTGDFDNNISVYDLKRILNRNSILAGIKDDSMLQGFIQSRGFRKNPFKAAQGIEPFKGHDARVEYYFETDHLKAGGLDEEGNIDFKDRGRIPRVEADELLAEKFPCRESMNGKNIFGQVIEVPETKDVKLKHKTGTRLSEDGLKVYSTVAGYPKLAWSGNIMVLDRFMVKGDVGYQTGHLDYEGNIIIQGCIKNGFKVVGYQIKTQEVDGGEVYADGDLEVSDGINGARIYARGNVYAKFVNKSEINCLGNVYVQKEIVDSKIENCGALIIKSGDVIFSEVASNMGIHAKNIGTEKSKPNTVTVGVDVFIEKEIKEIQDKIPAFEKEIDILKARKKKLRAETNSLHETSARLAFQLDLLTKENNTDIEKIAAPEKEKEGQNRISELTFTNKQPKKNRSKFDHLDRELNQCFDAIEKNDSRMHGMTNKARELEEWIEDLAEEQVNFTQWSAENPGKAVLTVEGCLFSGTFIYAKYSKKQVTKRMRKVKINEVRPRDEKTGAFYPYEIRIHDKI